MFNSLVKRLDVSNHETGFTFQKRVYGTREQLTQWFDRKTKAQVRLYGEVRSYDGFVMYNLDDERVKEHTETIKDLEHIK